jgi:hypothetical protein
MSVDIERLMVRGALAGLVAEIDDYCGTGPHPPIPHVPWLRDVLVGVAISRLAGSLEESPARDQLQKLSSELVKNGFKRAGSDPMPGIAQSVGR